MEGQPSVEELLNIIVLQRKALEFYSDKNNYNQNVNINSNLSSNIELDEGHQARFALEQSEKAMNYEEKLIEEMKTLKEYKDELTKSYENNIPIKGEDLMEQFKRKIEELKKLNND